jgi:phosphoglucosamine mutase
MKAGMAAGRIFTRGDHRHRVVIGKDTRLSGYMIESALVAGFTAVGMDVFLFGPLPTPAVAMLTRSLRADLGVMISASHNQFEDNGIKFFGPDGQKLSDEREAGDRSADGETARRRLAKPRKIGRAKRIDDARRATSNSPSGPFRNNCGSTAAHRDRLREWRGLQGGAAVLWELGAEVIAIGDDPDGFNINNECGSTEPEAMQRKVRERRADFGIALDGDADRVVMAGREGNHRRRPDSGPDRAPGRRTANSRAAAWSARSCRTRASTAILKRLDLKLARAAVGDRYVIEKMNRAASMSAASNPAISCSTISPPPATGSSRRCRCWRCWRRRASPPAKRRICSSRCRRCSRMCAFRRGAPLERCARDRAASRPAKRGSTAPAGCWCANRAPSPSSA